MNRPSNLLESILANIIANVVIGLAIIAIGAIIAFYSNNLQIGLLFTLTIFVMLNIALTFLLFRSQVSASRKQQSKVMLLRDAQTETHFLSDVHGRLREIPDESTSSFLKDALGVVGEIPTKPTAEIAAIRGERLIAIKDWEWKRPRTPEEQATLDLWHEVTKVIKKTASDFIDKEYPQKIVVQVSNVGYKPLYVRKVRFQHDNLQADDLDTAYQRDGLFTIIPFDQTNANIPPKGQFVLELKLSQWFERSRIELHKGHWGWLRFDLTYDGKPVDEIGIEI